MNLRHIDEEPSPDERSLTERQATYLAERSGFPKEELAELQVADVREQLKWHIDPRILTHQRVCGRVVRRDPVTGELHPVPFATVHVEDTDCSFLFYAPKDYEYLWLYPGHCSREEVATVQADECGNFCVWIPFWDIDHVVRWREERVCIPLLEPPRLIDILDPLIPELEREPIPRPRPIPDPPPEIFEPQLRSEVENRVGSVMADRLELMAPSRTFGDFSGAWEEALQEPAPRELLPTPPRPDPEEIGKLVELGDERLQQIDLSNPIGPFAVCHDVFVPVWQTVIDVPDITFRVTQDQNGSEVTIYDEGYFDVRWNDTSIPDVTLEVDPNAWWVEVCGEGPDVDCEDEPALQTASLMPLEAGYHDNTTGDDTFGYGIRVNQPSPDGIDKPLVPGPAAGDAQAPYADRLDLFGCVHIGNSTHYRVRSAFEGGPAQPIRDVNFPVLTGGGVDYQTPDGDGWYPIRNDLVSLYEHLILPWPTQQSRFADGRHEITVQAGTASGSGVSEDATSDPVTFILDNSRPALFFHAVRWWQAGSPPETLELDDCPRILRDPTKDVLIEVDWSASATHLRNATASMRGCSGGHPGLETGKASRKWYWENFGDTATPVKTARWRIPSWYKPGCYTLALSAVSRAYNPAVPGSSLSDDWWVSETRRHRHRRHAISVVDV